VLASEVETQRGIGLAKTQAKAKGKGLQKQNSGAKRSPTGSPNGSARSLARGSKSRGSLLAGGSKSRGSFGGKVKHEHFLHSRVYLHLWGASGLGDENLPPPNTYCVVSYEGVERRTGQVNGTRDPAYHQTFSFPMGGIADLMQTVSGRCRVIKKNRFVQPCFM
jgi:hypothetical protein